MEVNPEDRVFSREELLANVRGRDAVLCLLTDLIDGEVLDAARGAKIFANYAVGYDNLDIPAATQRGIWLSNTPGVLTEATAEMAWALLFAVARRVVEADNWNRAGNFRGWGPLDFLGQGIGGKTLGIIGAGRIGQCFARRAKGFEMTILYHSTRRKPDFEKECDAVFVDLDTLLCRSDFVSLHVPLLPETRHLLGEREFRLMKPSAILINTSRGPVVDEKALVEALRKKLIWAAGLDVYEREPEIEEGLKELDNVVLASHIGSATIEARTSMAMMAAQNIVSVLKGGKPITPVNEITVKG